MKIYAADNVWLIEREKAILKRGGYNLLRSFYYLKSSKPIREAIKEIKEK